VTDIAERLLILEAKSAIADLVNAYARAVREGDTAALAPLFTNDGLFRVFDPDGGVRVEIVGGQALADFYGRTIKKGEICPLVYDLMAEVRGDEAVSNCVMTGARPDGTPQFMGVYDDTYRRENGRWLFVSRIFNIMANAA
jgi:ketosteroid isomerase-like protein